MAITSTTLIQPNLHAVYSQALRVIELDFHTDPRWQEFVSAHPDALIYHHPAWLQALEREYAQKCLGLACENPAGFISGIMPLFYTRGIPFGVGGAPGRRRLASLPRTPLAGPLSSDAVTTNLLLQEAVRRVNSQRVSQHSKIQLQIKTQGPELDGLVEGVACTPWRLSYVLKLTAAPDGCFWVADSDHRHSIKKAVNKATRIGVRVRPAESLADLRAWYTLYLETMRRNVVPARSYRFFVALWELLRSQGMMYLLLAEQQKARGIRILAGTIFLRLGRTVSCGFNGSCASDLSLRPNDLIYWEAINDACKQGVQFFDFGEVADERPELARYKSKWGAEPKRLYRYVYPDLPERKDVSLRAPRQLATFVWRHLPLGVTAYLSDRAYSLL